MKQHILKVLKKKKTLSNTKAKFQEDFKGNFFLLFFDFENLWMVLL